jgi:hypothetical protein
MKAAVPDMPEEGRGGDFEFLIAKVCVNCRGSLSTFG